MPLTPKPRCASCEILNSPIWRRGVDGEVLCNQCYLLEQTPANKETNGENGSRNNGNGGNASSSGSHFIGTIRKSARIKPSKYRFKQHAKPLATKGKSRRVIFKKNPIRAPTAVASVITREDVFHKGTYFQVGDIVSVLDDADGEVYYAQLRGFLQDQYMELSAVVTWLLPTSASPPHTFDPATFILGPEEEFPRHLDAFEFVCHAPSDYFHAKEAPFRVQPIQPELGFVWSALGPEVVPMPSQSELFGMEEAKTAKERARDKEKEKKGGGEKERSKKEVVREKKEREVRVKREKVK